MGPQPQMFSEFILGTFHLPSGEEIHQPIPYSEFMKRVRNTWKVENQLAVFSKSGLRAKGFNKLSGTESEPKDPVSDKLTTLSELSAEAEMLLGPDGNTIETTFSFAFHGKLGVSSEVSDIDLSSHTTLWNGYSNVIYLSKISPRDSAPEESDLQLYIAVIIKSSVSNPGGWKVKTR